MNRRAFIALLGGAAASWPFGARAQQERVRRIGVLAFQAVDQSETQVRVAAFVRRLQELGWTEGRNLQLEYRWAAGDADSARRYAAELVTLAPDVILASGASIVSALQRAPYRADRVRECHRSHWCWVRRQPIAPGRQHHRIHKFRIRPQREMARAAQRARAPPSASGGSSRSC